MKKIIALILGLGIVCSLTSCKGSSTSSSSSTQPDSYTVNVYDLDDELLGSKTIAVSQYDSFYAALDAEFELVAPDSGYGHYISSINGSVVDSNWSMMVYVNGQSATVGIDDLVVNANDVIDIKNECWAAIDYGYGVTMDEYDVLVDKTLYHYIKTELKQKMESITTYTGYTYWEMLMINLLKTYGYDSSLLTFNYTSELASSISSADLDSFAATDWGKYYAHAKQLDLVAEDFVTKYTSFVENQMDTTVSPWTTPFYTFPAMQNEITSEKFNTISNSELTTDMTWGSDGRAWQMLCQSYWNDSYASADLQLFLNEWDNCASYAHILSVFAAVNENVRDDSYNIGSKDIIEVMFDEYYDSTTNLLKVYKTDTTINMSTNQVYAGLSAYKAWRDQYTKQAVNLLGAH